MDRNINCNSNFTQKKHVALRKESVDRNSENPMIGINKIPSLSARRAWIEITQRRDFKRLGLRRSPQGERG